VSLEPDWVHTGPSLRRRSCILWDLSENRLYIRCCTAMQWTRSLSADGALLPLFHDPVPHSVESRDWRTDRRLSMQTYPSGGMTQAPITWLQPGWETSSRAPVTTARSYWDVLQGGERAVSSTQERASGGRVRAGQPHSSLRPGRATVGIWDLATAKEPCLSPIQMAARWPMR